MESAGRTWERWVQHDFEPLGDGRCLIRLSGEIDLAVVPDIIAEFEYAIEQVSAALVVDVSAVDFIDSSGLAALVRMREVARSHPGGGLVLTGAGDAVTELLQLTRLDRIFEITDLPEPDQPDPGSR